MCNWKKWIWPGLLAVALLTALAVLMRGETIEADLKSKAMTALSAGHPWADVTLDGRDLTLTGVAPSEEAAAEALSIAANAYDVRVATSQTTLLPIADPFTLSAVKSDDGAIALSGSVPDEATRAALVEAANAAAGGASVSESLTLNRGAPEGFAALGAFALSQLAGLGDGSVSLSGSDLSIAGTAATVDSFNAITSALGGAIPGNGAVAENAVVSPAISPYTFAAEKSETGITLTGYVPDEAGRQALVGAAEAATAGTVTDNLEIGQGAADGFADLAGFSLARLAEFSTGSVALTDERLSVRGTALSPEAYDATQAALAGDIPGGGTLSVTDITPSVVSPYTFSARRDEGIMVLEGYVASQGDRDAVVAAAGEASPDLRIVDRLKLARGAPDGLDWPAAARFAVQQAAGLESGTVSLDGAALTVDGVAGDTAMRDTIEGAVTDSLPAGMELASSDVRLPVIDPYVWRFESMEGKAPRLSGYQPGDMATDTLIEEIVSRVGNEFVVVNELQTGAGAPAGFEAAASVAVQAATRLQNGVAELTGTELTVTGEALTEQSAAAVRTIVANALPPGFTGTADITVLDVAALPAFGEDECQALLNSYLQHNSIRFESGQAVIRPDSFGLLERLAFSVKRCPSAVVRIEGHTDSDGSDEANQALSVARANAVRSYLLQHGVFAGRMTAAGYGESRPIADNATDEGKALNRRIEFTVTR